MKIKIYIKEKAVKLNTSIQLLLPYIIVASAIILWLVTIFMSPQVILGVPQTLNTPIAITLSLAFLFIMFTLGKFLGNLLKSLPTIIFGAIGAIFLFINIPGISQLSPYLIALGSLFGLAAFFIAKKGLGSIFSRCILTSLSIFFGYILVELYSQGNDDFTAFQNNYYTRPELESLLDPSLPGELQFNYLTYGSGTDKQRIEFGEEATLITDSFNATTFLDPSGFLNNIRERFWGFGAANYPLNGRVWYPDGDGQFPLILIVHGNHPMNDFSDGGYDYLGELLASRGNIVVSVDENFLNGSSFDDYGQSENIVRGILLLEHLKYWKTWKESSSNVFYNKVDLENIILIGHSRGGQAVAIASEFDNVKKYHKDGNLNLNYDFTIKGIVQIAPNDPYQPTKGNPLIIKDTNYLLIQGGYDADVHTPLGNRVYNRLELSDSSEYFKSVIYSYRSNHGQFNTSWGKYDTGYPKSQLLNVKPLLAAEDQRRIAEVYISAFVETVTGKTPSYKRIFKDFRNALQWLPEDYFVSQYEDTNSEKLVTYEEDFDITTSEVIEITGINLLKWSEDAQLMRNSQFSPYANNLVMLGWDTANLTNNEESPEYSLNWPAPLTISNTKTISFDLANVQDNGFQIPEFTIRLKFSDNNSIDILMSDIGQINPALNIKLYKWDFLNELGRTWKDYENVLQRYVISPQLISTVSSKQESELTGISFIFNQSPTGEIMLDNIAAVSFDDGF